METKYIVLIPAYNAQKHINELLVRIQRVCQNNVKILVVDDGSVDETVSIVKQFDNVSIIKHSVNCGKGEALKSGIQFVFNIFSICHAIIFLDSDLQHVPEKIPDFILIDKSFQTSEFVH